MRKFTYKPLISGILQGLDRGLSSTDFAFDYDVLPTPKDRFEGIRHDRDALREDVERAKNEFERTYRHTKESVAAR